MKEKMPEYKARSIEYLLALTSYIEYVKLINPNGKTFEKLHNWLIENETYFRNEDRSLPTIKELANLLKLDYFKAQKSLSILYKEILELNDKEPGKFKSDNQYLCYLNFNHQNVYTHFNVGLNFIPRVNDQIDFWFIKPMNGGSNYFVKEVYHELRGFTHEIRIYLTSEEQYWYLQLLKEKAYLQGSITSSEYVFPLTLQLKQELLKSNRHL